MWYSLHDVWCGGNTTKPHIDTDIYYLITLYACVCVQNRPTIVYVHTSSYVRLLFIITTVIITYTCWWILWRIFFDRVAFCCWSFNWCCRCIIVVVTILDQKFCCHPISDTIYVTRTQPIIFWPRLFAIKVHLNDNTAAICSISKWMNYRSTICNRKISTELNWLYFYAN